jgi:hypothetical protein
MTTAKKRTHHKKVLKKHAMYGKILAFDMGTKNLFFSVLDNKTLIDTNYVQNTVTSLLISEYQTLATAFRKEIIELITRTSPEAVVIERFQYRPGVGGVIELVNVMVGIITNIALSMNIDVQTPTASSWKNNFQNVFGKDSLKELYKLMHPFPPHGVDSHLQACYFSKHQKHSPYEGWKKSKLTKARNKWILYLLEQKKKRKEESALRRKSNT